MSTTSVRPTPSEQQPPTGSGHQALLEAPASGGPRVRLRYNFKRLADMPILYFAALLATVLLAAITGTLPDTMIVGFAVTLVFGGVFIWIGNLVPGLRDFGLPTILCTFMPATLIFFGILPQNAIDVVTTFVTGAGFLDFFVIAVIAGTILGMPRTLLLKAGPRFAVPLVGALLVTFLVIGAIGGATGFGFLNAILFIAAPIMAGGLGLGAVPMSEMYATKTGGTSEQFMGDLMSAVVFANIICILIAGFYNFLTKKNYKVFAGFNGHGQLLRVDRRATDLAVPDKRSAASFLSLGKGLMIAGCLFVLGTMLNAVMPILHPYAWTIIAAALVKIFKLFPEELETASAEWGDMLMTYFVPALLVGVSISYIKIDEVLASLSNPAFVGLTIATVVVAALSSGVIG